MAAARRSRSPGQRPSIPKLIVEEPEGEDADQAADLREPQFCMYDPVTHVAVPVDSYYALINAKTALDERSLALVQADAKKVESLVMGFSTGNSQLQDQIAKEREFSDRQRALADNYREQLEKKERQLSEMIRQSEDAKLERERLAADMRRAEMMNERLEMELNAKLKQEQAKLDAMKTASAPVFAAVGQGLGGLLAQYTGKAALSASGASTLPSSSNPDGAAPQVQVSLDGVEDFRNAFLQVYNTLGPQSVAGLRAVVCSAVLAAHGAPALPKSVKDGLMISIMSDAGSDKVQVLLQESGRAYCVAEASTATAPN